MSNYGLGNISAPWTQRVLKEKEDLDIKIEKLVVMKRYSYLLGERLRVGAKNYEDQAQSD